MPTFAPELSMRSAGWGGAVPRHDEGADALAIDVVGRSAHRNFLHGRVRRQHVLDLAGGNVLAAADDDVLHAVGHDEVAVVVEAAEVPGAEPRAVDERVV